MPPELITRFAHARSAKWAAAVAFVYLLLVFSWDSIDVRRSSYVRSTPEGHFWSYQFRQFFSANERNCADTECIGELIATAPTLAAFAYSLGAWLEHLRQRRSLPTGM